MLQPREGVVRDELLHKLVCLGQVVEHVIIVWSVKSLSVRNTQLRTRRTGVEPQSMRFLMTRHPITASGLKIVNLENLLREKSR